MGAPAFDRLKVVVIDDNHLMRSLLHSMLYAFGIRTIIGSADGKSGFATVRSVKPDFVLTDFSMEPVNGVEFVRMIRALPEPMAYLPIIMVTGHGERHYIERARDAGVTELLTKPVTARDLYIRIMDIVERPRKFIESPSYIGPDRRRKPLREGTYPKRRQTDFEDEMEFR
jgi:two-component system, chemotaxis family, chemotaxis protein CheY